MRRAEFVVFACRILIFMINLTILTTAFQVAGAAELPSYDRVRILESPRPISDAELLDHNGESYSFGDLRGRVAIVFFGFTNCPDVCPLMMDKFRQLERSGYVDKDKVAFVFISVDGERDSPEVMARFLAKFSPDFIGLTGDPTVVNAVAKEFRASFYKGQVSANDGGYSMMHSPQAFVLDSAGRLRAEFHNAAVDAMAGIASALVAEGD